MRSFVFLLFLLFCSLATAQTTQEGWQYTAQEIDVSISISSGVTLKESSPEAFIDYAEAQITFIPQEAPSQDVVDLSTTPTAQTKNNSFIFYWDNPQEGTLSFSIDATMRSRPHFVPILKKISYPLITLPAEVQPYLEHSEHINSDDPAIHLLASTLARGKDDLYDIVFTTAEWTRQHIEYNLSTLTADVAQPASWVLEKRTGVCDELTSLFIAMLRSIAARCATTGLPRSGSTSTTSGRRASRSSSRRRSLSAHRIVVSYKGCRC